MKTKLTPAWFASLLFLFCFVTPLSAATLISINTGSGEKAGAAYTYVDEYVDYWNNYHPTNGSGEIYADGVLVPLYDVPTNSTGAGLLVYNVQTNRTYSWGDDMFNSSLRAAGTNLIVVFTNLPAGLYDVYVYGHGESDELNGVFELTSAATHYGRKATAAVSGWDTGYFEENQQFVLYANVAVPAGQNLRLDVLTNSVGEAILNGLQILSKTIPTQDSDGDGINDATEITNGTDPYAADTDGDGVSDSQEATDMTNPLDPFDYQARLLLRLGLDDSGTWAGTDGEAPVAFAGLGSVSGVTNYAGEFVTVGTNLAYLQYRLVETNGTVNMGVRNGGVRFYYQPYWDTAGGGPGTHVRLLELGTSSIAGEHGSWTFYIGPEGTNVVFATRAEGGTLREHFNAAFTWTTNMWYEVVLDYTLTNSALYIGGTNVVTGSGVDGVIPAQRISVGGTGTNVNTIPPYWVNDPCQTDPNNQWELHSDSSTYFGHWVGTWVEDSGMTHPNTYYREVYDACWNVLYGDYGYWLGLPGNDNGSAFGAIDELEVYNEPRGGGSGNPPPPASNDNDNDGLTNDEEATLGTDPDDPDTDGDGLSDYLEVQRGWNPLVAAQPDTGGAVVRLRVHTRLE